MFMTPVCYLYIANECVRLLENCIGIWLPMPSKIKEALLKLKEGEKKELVAGVILFFLFKKAI